MIGIAGNMVKNLRKIGRLDLNMHSKNLTLFSDNLRWGSYERDSYFNDAKKFFKI